MRSLIVVWFVVCLGACAAPQSAGRSLPEFRLPLDALGISLNLVQHLTVSRISRGVDVIPDAGLDALLEIDAQSLRLAALVLGQRVMTVQWDGQELVATRNRMVPAAIDAAHVLRDIQLLYWPVEAIRSRLPVSWSITEVPGRRTVLFENQVQVEILYTDSQRWLGQAELSNFLEGYRMRIESAVAGAALP